jgi:AraC-like DNA-binding protein
MLKAARPMKQRRESSGPLLAAAAAEPLARIRKDRERVEPGIGRILAQIEENLFDYDLSLTFLKRRCGVRDNGLLGGFTSALGKSPWAYIEQRRMETACWLLVKTRLPVWEIALLVGYSGRHVFSRAFRRWAGVRPGAYREEPAARTATIWALSIHFAGPASGGEAEMVGDGVGKWPLIQRRPDLGEGPCRRLELWLPADVYSWLGVALARLNRVGGDHHRRFTERDLIIAALVDWLPTISPAISPTTAPEVET